MIERLYPESQFFIYDGGLSVESRERLSSFENTVIVDWREQSDFEANVGRLSASIARFESKIKDNPYLYHLYHEVLGFELPYADIIRWNFYTQQKPLSILDLTNRVEGNIVWIDDDAVVINRFDEIFDSEFDVGVTLRSKYDERKQGISPLNSGVVFFNTSPKKTRTFVTTWLDVIDRIELTKHREQTALSILVSEEHPQVYDEYYSTANKTVDGTNITIRTFPCRLYNYAAFTGGIDPEANKILHFRGGRTLAEDVNKELIADIRQNDLSNWHRGGLD